LSDIILTAYDGAILGPIAKLLGFIMNAVYSFMVNVLGIGNISIAIIVFTIVIYLCLFPVTYKQQKYSKLTQKMQPELKKIQKKYQGKKDAVSMQAMQDETSAVYEKYGVSPTGSCIYMLINMPIIFALWRVFNNIPAYLGIVRDQFTALVEGIMATPGYQDTMTNIVETLKINTVRVDFSVKDESILSNYLVDTLYAMNTSGWETLKEKFSGLSDIIASTQENLHEFNQFLGMNISDSPLSIIKSGISNGTYLIAFLALMIPISSYLTQMLSMKLMPQAEGADDAMGSQMKMINRIMPLTSLFFCFSFPVGLGVYWIISALVRSAQQVALNKHFEKVNLDDIIKENREKAKKKREKKGITENKINQAARINTKKLNEPALSAKEKETLLEKAATARNSAKAGSMSEKANLVKKFNEKNTK
jgi:YidC/Oxa1 family membrane protein insertase